MMTCVLAAAVLCPAAAVLDTDFKEETQLRWDVEPRFWRRGAAGGLHVWAEPGTDVWAAAHADSGRSPSRVLSMEASGDVVTELWLSQRCRHKGDSAGVLLRGGESWVKASVECGDLIPKVSVAHSSGGAVHRSSQAWYWSGATVNERSADARLRVTNDNGTVAVEVQMPHANHQWHDVAVAAVDFPSDVSVGLYTAAPSRRKPGPVAHFQKFSVKRCAQKGACHAYHGDHYDASEESDFVSESSDEL
eukprot:TRINITY_DN5747_c8_g1_i1.p1 TRINITY_DN5747_c8_g1~~TRINITY_DN5747_c8_g1_i1.p1  ORF type:complete len:248 (+),score=67.66 TRINITY_DN5747_c8_g1_i1:95-838(+)